MIFRATYWGPWAFSDSSAYISAARNIKAGIGAVIQNSDSTITPVTEFPPFFPFTLSLLTPANGNFLESTRWINIFLFSVCTFIISQLSFIASKNLLSGFFASALFVFSPVMIDTFSGFMSEPLFIGLLLFLVYLFLKFVHSQKMHFLTPFFILSSILPMIRYAGILFIICFSLLLLILIGKRSRKTILLASIYLVTSLAPIGVWFIVQYTKLNRVAGKSFIYDIEIIRNIFSSIVQEMQVIRGWMPYSGIYPGTVINNWLLAFFSGLFIISLVTGLIGYIKDWKIIRTSPHLLFMICLFLLIAYVLFIGFTHNLTIPSIDIIDRMMAPIYPFLILAFILGFGKFDKNKFSRYFGLLILIAGIFSIRFYLLSSLSSVRELNINGKGYTSRQYQESDLLEELASLHSNQIMISNSAAFVLFNTNRFPYPVEQFHNKPFGSGNSYGEKAFRQKNAALIILYPEFRNYYGKNSDQLLKNLTAGLQVDFQDEIGGIYFYPGKLTPQ